jgi:hypothetical protein
MNSKIIRLGEREINHNPFRISLTERKDGQELPRNMEISGIKLHNVNLELLDSVSIYIGGSEILSFEGNEMNNIILPEDGILLSKCIYHCVDIYFHFNKQYIKNKSKIVLEDEYETEEVETDEYVYVRNPETGEIYSTNVIKLIKKPTGRKIEVSVSDPVIKIPEIEITLKPIFESSDQLIESIIWQKYLITPEYDTWEYIKSMIDRFELQMPDGSSVEEYYKKGKPFYSKIKNKLKYIGQMAGLAYGF